MPYDQHSRNEAARLTQAKSASDRNGGNIGTPIAGALGGALGPLPAAVGGGLAAGVTGPHGHQASRALSSGFGGGMGSAVGGLTGAALGGLGGYYLSDKNKDTAAKAALLGTLLGSMAGGGLGASVGRSYAMGGEKRGAYDFGKTAALQKLGLFDNPAPAASTALGTIAAPLGPLTAAALAPSGYGGKAFLGSLGGGLAGTVGGGGLGLLLGSLTRNPEAIKALTLLGGLGGGAAGNYYGTQAAMPWYAK